MRVSWPEFVVLVLLALLAQLLGGPLGVVVVDGKGVESFKGKGGGLRGLDWLSGECCLDSCLDGCLDGTDLFGLWFPALTGFSVVVLFATCETCGPVCGAFSSSVFTIGPFVNWSLGLSDDRLLLVTEWLLLQHSRLLHGARLLRGTGMQAWVDVGVDLGFRLVSLRQGKGFQSGCG